MLYDFIILIYIIIKIKKTSGKYNNSNKEDLELSLLKINKIQDII